MNRVGAIKSVMKIDPIHDGSLHGDKRLLIIKIGGRGLGACSFI